MILVRCDEKLISIQFNGSKNVWQSTSTNMAQEKNVQAP